MSRRATTSWPSHATGAPSRASRRAGRANSPVATTRSAAAAAVRSRGAATALRVPLTAAPTTRGPGGSFSSGISTWGTFSAPSSAESGPWGATTLTSQPSSRAQPRTRTSTRSAPDTSPVGENATRVRFTAGLAIGDNGGDGHWTARAGDAWRRSQ